MKAATIAEIKRALKDQDQLQMIDLCLRLGRFKKDNKELLTYLLFEQQNEQAYIHSVRIMMGEAFHGINRANIYWAKKSIRKILRNVNKFIRYSGKKQTQIELLMYFCRLIVDSGIKYKQSTALYKLFWAQLDKIEKSLDMLHEDLRADYAYELDELRS